MLCLFGWNILVPNISVTVFDLTESATIRPAEPAEIPTAEAELSGFMEEAKLSEKSLTVPVDGAGTNSGFLSVPQAQ